MPRIPTPPTIEDAPETARPLLQAVKRQLGVAPNLMRLISNSPETLAGYLGLNQALAGGKLSAQTRERIALTIANINGCTYCNSAHTYLGKNAKLDDAEIAAARDGRSADPKAHAALHFARAVAVKRGAVSDAEFNAVRAAGYADAEILEIVGAVALNTLTNYVNDVFKTDVDFPVFEAKRLANV